MDLFENSFLIIAVLAILVLVILYFFLGNFSWDKPDLEDEVIIPESVKKESPLGEIFHLYKHESEKKWAEWISHQDKAVKAEALDKLFKHLSDKPEKWGCVTLEVIESLKAFQGEAAGKPLSKFISRLVSLWRNYSSIPNYYKKSIEVLICLEPELALKIFNEEFDKEDNSDAALERKRSIISVLSALEDTAKELFARILCSNEISAIKYQTLRNCIEFKDEIRKDIFLETLRHLAEKYRNFTKPLRVDDINFLEDIVEDSLGFIANYDFHKAINSLCINEQITERVLAPIIKRLNKEKANFDLLAIYSMSMLADTKQNEVKKLLAKRNELEFNEIETIILHNFIEEFTEENLQDSKFQSSFPIPLSFEGSYKDFKNLLSKSIDDLDGRSCEKNSSGMLVYGDDRIRKLYFARALAKEKNWTFKFIDLEYYLNHNLHQDFQDMIINLSKPYLLYLTNPNILFENPNDQKIAKEKFIRTLNVQGLDSKAIYIGDVNYTFQELEQNRDLKETVKLLCGKFFPTILEISLSKGKSKIHIIEDFLKNTKPERIERKKELVEDLLKAGEDKDSINFAFFIAHVFRTILLVFGRDVAYDNVKGLFDQFENQANATPVTQNSEPPLPIV